jgi:hypothetical protein
VKFVPLIVSVAVEGNEFTDVGLTLQLPAPYVFGQLNVTVPANPSCDAIAIAPVEPVLPALITGKAVGSVKTKSGLEVTFRVNDRVRAAVPAVDAWIVTG